jgi:hypothetical protein
MSKTILFLFICLLSVYLTGIAVPELSAEDYLDSDEALGIGAGSAAVFGLGQWLRHFDLDRKPLIDGPILFDRSLQSFLGGEYYPGKTNFLDNTFGSAVTGVGAGLILFTADINWPRGDKIKTVMQDMFLFTAGITATKGVTDMVKGVFARPRPYTYYTEITFDNPGKYRKSRHSFFSGHSSSAFFATAFLNKRLRSIMRSELSASEYHDWRWAPPAVLFGWASYVGYSRIHAYKHHFSDVILGAAAGILIAELFYWFGENEKENAGEASGVNYLFKISFSF